MKRMRLVRCAAVMAAAAIAAGGAGVTAVVAVAQESEKPAAATVAAVSAREAARPDPTAAAVSHERPAVACKWAEELCKTTPWGEPVEGLVSRLVMKPTYCIGEPVVALVQISNVTDRAIIIHDRFDTDISAYSSFEVSDTLDGAIKRTSDSVSYVYTKNLRVLEAGESVPIEFSDISKQFLLWSASSRHPTSPFDGRDLAATFTYQSVPLTVSQVSTQDEALLYKTGLTPGESARAHAYIKARTINGIAESLPRDRLQRVWGFSASPRQLTLKSNSVRFSVQPPSAANLTVHEWGVFTVFNGRALANANRKAEWESLPDEFYRQFPKGKQRLRWEPAAWDKPIVYFYTDKPNLNVSVDVTFKSGAPVVWWPCASQPEDSRTWPTNPPALPMFRTLTWLGSLGDVFREGYGSATNPFKTNDAPLWTPVGTPFAFTNGWVADARIPSAAKLTVEGSGTMSNGSATHPSDGRRSRLLPAGRHETEHFIYYDGLVPSPDYLRCVASDDESVTVKNTASFEIGELFLVDRRRPGNDLFTTVAGLKPGVETRVAFSRNTNLKLDPKKVLANCLLAAGLYRAEVDSLLKIWGEGLFARPGVTAFYVLPRAEYDRMIKLTVSPAPPEVVRVGIALHPNFEAEPALAARAQALIARLSAGGADADAAARELLDIGPTATRAVREAMAGTPSPELKTRGQAILDQIDASDYMK